MPSWTAGDALAASGMRLLLWAAIATGPVAFVLQMSTPPPVRTAPPVTASEAEPARQAVSEAAQAWVVAWLTTPQSQLATLQKVYPLAAGLQLPVQPSKADHAAVAAVTPVGSDGVWSVVIAADVSGPGQKGTTHQYFQVPVSFSAAPSDRGADPARVSILGLPSPIAGPDLQPAGRSAYGQPLALTNAVGQTVTAFVGALVAGQGDITRYTSPSSQIRAVQPPTATSIRLTSLATDQPVTDDVIAAAPESTRIRVLAGVDLIDALGQARPAQYAVTLSARAGRWEVLQTDPAPSPDGTAPAVTTPQSTAPADSTTQEK